MSTLHQQECTHLENVTFAMEQHRSEVDNETKQDYQSNRDEIKTKVISFNFIFKISFIISMTRIPRVMRMCA